MSSSRRAAGGRCTVAGGVARSRRSRTSSRSTGRPPRPTGGRARGGAAARPGACPASERYVPYGDGRAAGDLRRRRAGPGDQPARASVVRKSRTSAPSASTTSAMTWPGSAASSAAVSRKAGLGGAGVADRRGEVGDEPVAHAELLGQPPRWRGRGCRRWRRGRPGRRPDPRSSSASSHAACAEGDVAGLAEPLLPHLRAGVAGRAPAVEELLGGRAAAEELGEHGAVALVADRRGPRRRRRRRTRRRRRPGPCGGRRSTTRCGAPAAQGGVERADRRAHRAVGVERADVAAEPQRGVDGGGVGLVDVGGRDGGEPQRVRGQAAERPQRRAGRLDAHGGGVLVVARRRCGCPCRRRCRPRPRSWCGRAAGRAGTPAAPTMPRDVMARALRARSDGSSHSVSTVAPVRLGDTANDRRGERTASPSTACASSPSSRCRRSRTPPSCWPGSAPTW